MAQISLDNFERMIGMAAELAGRQLSSEARKFYYNGLSHLDTEQLKKAFAYYGNRGTLPTVEEILDLCGYQQQRPNAQKRQEAPAPSSKKSEPATWDTEYGDWAFELRYHKDSAADAEEYFLHICRTHLTGKGWRVSHFNDYVGEQNVEEGGRFVRKQTIRKRIYFATRDRPAAGT